ncbi:MAG: PEP-CTERM sorting domain-containing protein, partial [Phycisphaerae bacterium]|nr:PEP-CTERM sorting domain-containing protein [Phycisphaerae bacterium]
TDILLGRKAAGAGTYNISGGSLSVANFEVGPVGSGTLNITNAAADITVTNLLHFGADSTLTAVAGSTIHMTGSAFENENIDAADLAGLENLTLIFEGGVGDIDPFEVAGQDVGGVGAGWTANFALEALELGGIDVGYVQLVDNFDNQAGFSEALYVNSLIVGAGSTLDLNGLNLYYHTGTITGSIINGTATQAPEPATMGLMAIGLAGLFGTKRRRSLAC